jgi:hypothetical protein
MFLSKALVFKHQLQSSSVKVQFNKLLYSGLFLFHQSKLQLADTVSTIGISLGYNQDLEL